MKSSNVHVQVPIVFSWLVRRFLIGGEGFGSRMGGWSGSWTGSQVYGRLRVLGSPCKCYPHIKSMTGDLSQVALLNVVYFYMYFHTHECISTSGLEGWPRLYN